MSDGPDLDDCDDVRSISSIAVSSEGVAQHSQDLKPAGDTEFTGLAAQDDDKDDDRTAIEYARDNGLCRNHITERYEEVAAIQEDVYSGCLVDSHLPQFDLGMGYKVEERVSVSKNGAALLAKISQEEAAESINALVFPLPGRRAPGIRKLELPLLRSDHETDCKNFANRDGFEIKLKDIRLPLETVDEENGQGLGWPARFWDIGSTMLDKCKAEKIGMSKDTALYLQSALKITWTAEDDKNLWQTEMKYKRNLALEPVTPPLSPLHIKPEPYEPSSTDSAFDVPIISDPVSPTKKQLQEIEAKIFEQDIPTPLRPKRGEEHSPHTSSDTYANDEDGNLNDICDPFLAALRFNDIPTLEEIPRIKRQDLYVEEPLTPGGPHISPPKTVRFSDIIEELRLDEPERLVNLPGFENAFFENTFAASLVKANQRSEQERLIAADATARVDVPVMDFSKPQPPWKKFENQKNAFDLLSLQKSFIKDVLAQSVPLWPEAKKNNLKLRWMPFDKSFTKNVLDEYFRSDHAALESYMNNPEDQKVIDSSDCTWKREGLKILRDDDDDEEDIGPGTFRRDEPPDMSFLIKKRKAEMQERAVENASSSKPQKSGDPDTNPTQQSLNQNTNSSVSASHQMRIDGSGGAAEDFGSLLGGTFSAAGSLDNYLELRGNKKQKLMDSTYFGAKVTKPTNSITAPPQAAMEDGAHQIPIRLSPIAKLDSLPAPPTSAQAGPTSIIVASALLKHRTLIKHLENLLPSLTLIERDFTAHNSTAWMLGTVTRSPIISPLASEADMIISASTGIIITTLQRIKQKLLPGQKGKTAIRDRVQKVSLRYEKLVVFVSEGNSDEHSSGMGDAEALAFNEFMGFALGLDASIMVHFVGGGEETLAKWLANTIVRNRVSADLDLLPDETHWELFLRRAGLNAFAAQIIISELKAPDGVNLSSPTKAGQFGLTAFVEMAPAQRIARFGRICGARLLTRVSAIVDGVWE